MEPVESVNVLPTGAEAPTIKEEIISSTTAAPIEEAPKEEPKVETKPEPKEKIAPKLASVKARERAAQEKAAALEQKEREIQERAEKFEKVRNDPKAALEALGVTFEQLTEAIINEKPLQEENPLDKAHKRIDSLEAQIKQEKEEEARQKEALEQAKIDAARDDYKVQINELVQSTSDKYELIQANEAQDLVFEVAAEYWAKHQEIITPQQAADLVEDYLWKKTERLLELKKVQAAVQPKPKPKTSFGKTLTNQAGAFAASPASESKNLTPDERRRRAAKLIRFN